jgi:uncharacterized repeat protein (TIGR02543 family)
MNRNSKNNSRPHTETQRAQRLKKNLGVFVPLCGVLFALAIGVFSLAGCDHPDNDKPVTETPGTPETPARPVSPPVTPPPTVYVSFLSGPANRVAVPQLRDTPAGGTVALPDREPEWTDHTFYGWWTGNGVDHQWGERFTVGTPVTEDINVYARWEKPGDGLLKVRFLTYTQPYDELLTTYGEQKFVEYGGTVPLPDPPPTRVGRNFLGWNTEKDGRGADFDGSTKVTRDMEVYAQWSGYIYRTITFNKTTDTSSSPPNPMQVLMGGTAGALPTLDNREAYSGSGVFDLFFDGWWTNYAADFGIYGDRFTEYTPVPDDITVYAKWTLGKQVVFDKNVANGNLDLHYSIYVLPGTAMGTLPAPPTRPGYTFGGWYESADGGVTLGAPFTASTLVQRSIIVYAKWIP